MGLGDIDPEVSLSVMEGKALLYKYAEVLTDQVGDRLDEKHILPTMDDPAARLAS